MAIQPMISGQRSNLSSPAPASGAGEGGAWDEAMDRAGKVRPHWQGVMGTVQRWSADERGALSAEAGRMLADLGRTFNVYSDAGGADQPFQIDPLPMVVAVEEWQKVAAGLAQRMRLLEKVLQDIHGPQELLSKGLLPPDLLHSNPAFRMQLCGANVERHLMVMGTDLVRSSEGVWMVLKDHTRQPGGLGQALENRSVVADLLPGLFDSSQVAALGSFFELERVVLRSMGRGGWEVPNVVLLTQGFRHPSYFEHAYKARLLGIPLVEAADLTVRERRLFLKTLSGLRKVDGLAVRLDDDEIDPLEAESLGASNGVPGLLEAWRSGNVTMANAPGSGMASCESLMPFLGRICREWLGEEMKLPFVETWWLGQPEIRRQVLDQLQRYVLMRANGRDPLLPLRGATLSPAARRQWAATIEARPHDFVVQRDVAPGLVPSLRERALKSQPVVWRTFTLAQGDAPVVMPGGLVRVGQSHLPPQLWRAHAGYTKDVWVCGAAQAKGVVEEGEVSKRSAGRHPASFEVPSRMAEQLFWVGRYAERVELTTRLLRVTLRRVGGEVDSHRRGQLQGCLELLRCLDLPGELNSGAPERLIGAIAGWVHDPSAARGIATLTGYLISNAASARDRLSDDMWRFFNRLEAILRPAQVSRHAPDLLRTLDALVLHLSAFSGMQAENMTRGQGWRFLESGRRIERALGVFSLAEVAMGALEEFQTESGGRVLEPLLEVCDSSMTYRRRYFSRPRWEAVADLLLFDRTNPRSVAHQARILREESGNFPGDPESRLAPAILKSIAEIDERFADPVLPGVMEVQGWAKQWENLSDLLTQQYFSHSVRRVY